MEDLTRKEAIEVNRAFVAKLLALKKPTTAEVELANALIENIPKDFILKQLTAQPTHKKE